MQRHPEGPRFRQRAEGSPIRLVHVLGDPSLRLKNGFAQDDAHFVGFKMSYHLQPNACAGHMQL